MKKCRDYAYIGVECCIGCHDPDPEDEVGLITIQISGEMAYVCCAVAYFFYPDGEWKDRSMTGQWTQDSGSDS